MSSWQYKLFFSVDLENSTRYKFASGSPEELFVWSTKFEAFYEDFNNTFYKECGEYARLVKPDIWKLVGDEILYHCNITDSSSVEKYVTAFQKAVKNYNKEEHEKNCDRQLPELLCKGTVWGAGFPIRNRVVKTPLGKEDYLGVDIDIGFRLAKYSSSDKITVSLPVAYILALHDFENLRYFDKQSLKGFDALYPIFWISSMHKTCPEFEWGKTCTYQSIVEYCETLFVDDFSKPFIKPFIHNDESGKCGFISGAALALKSANDKIEAASTYAKAESALKTKSSRRKVTSKETLANIRKRFIEDPA